MSLLLEYPLSIDEVNTMLQNMKNNKSPGQLKFYRFFWADVNHMILW